MKIKGKNLRLIIDGVAVPEETNCSVSITANTQNIGTKDDGDWDIEGVMSKTWQASVENYQAEHGQLLSVLLMFINEDTVPVGFDYMAGEDNRVLQNASFSRRGNALLNDFTFNFNDREFANVSLQFQGTGALS